MQLRAIVGEIRLDAHGAALERDDRQQIRGGHLGRDVTERGPIGPHLVAGRHRGQIEVQHQEPSVPEPRVARRRNGERRLRGGRHVARGRGGGAHGRGRAGPRLAGQPLVLDERHVLRLAVLGDHEVLRRQPFDGTAGSVLHGDGLHDEPRARAEHRRLIRHLHLPWRWSLARGRRAALALRGHGDAERRHEHEHQPGSDRHQNLRRALLCSRRI